MKRLIATVTMLGLLLGSILVAADTPTTTFNPNTDATFASSTSDYVIVTLGSPPAAAAPGLSRARGGKLNLQAADVRNYRANLAQHRKALKDWARSNAPRAAVVAEYDIVLNAVAVKLNGTRRDTLATAPGVASVAESALYRPDMNRSVSLINADDVWNLGGGPSNAGAGIKVGIIDTGIKENHAFFAPGQVVVERVYCSGCPGITNDDMWSDHGTHVAGTVAGQFGTTATVEGVSIPGLSGVAPAAKLGDYNVFPRGGAGFVAFGGSAFSHDIARALEDAVKDGMDVVNMSLGGGVQGPHDALAEATNNTVAAGVVAAVAAGNSGPGGSTVQSPGSAERALTAGASTNPHFVGISVAVGATTRGAALGDFNNFDPAITAAYTVTTPANGCTTISTGLAGKIALIDRGTCTFTTKIRNAQNAGAVGVLVANNVAGDPTAMGHDGTDPFPTIPAAMLSKNDGAAIKPSGTATVDGTVKKEFVTANADIIAGFSSRGPSPFNFLIKPDVAAPGVNVLSSTFDTSQGTVGADTWSFFQGTSMATPHVAGAAALLRWRHPDWTPDQVKSALVTTAKRPVFDHVTGTNATGVLTRGGGRIDVLAATQANATFAPASVSFGFHQGSAEISENRTVTHTAGASATIAVAQANPTAGLNITITTSGGSFTATLTASKSVASGDYTGDIVVTTGGQTHRLPYWIRIDRKAKP
ncbi:MAG TPA: S8 family serine peptidase [Candidatus Limnocylindria bacterium]|jgi:minor extracellular serine protease Vpr|nr:S8 family serine peptidase [Candidatus Limnocylindria bacterium]